MISTNLIIDLEPHLKEAEELWVAVALMKDSALKKIQEAVPSHCKQHYLIGIDLPTSPTVFQTLKENKSDNLKSAVYKNSSTYHPKVYLLKKNTGFIAFVGSANATQGGFSNNIELCFLITDQIQCKKLLNWFQNLYSKGKEITDTFLERYKASYKNNLRWRSAQKSNTNSVFNNSIEGTSASNIKTEQFFHQSDFNAFDPIYHTDKSALANGLRKAVRLRLLELHNLIFSHFVEYDITDLHTPLNSRNYTSQYFHSRGSLAKKDAIWLNYGKSANQLSASVDKSFTNNIRIQVILRNDIDDVYIGIWLFVGKPDCSIEDRQFIKDNIGDPVFLNLAYNLLLELGGAYWIGNGEDFLPISNLMSNKQLFDFLIKDDFSDYYIIGRNYNPNDDDLSRENISETVLIEFSKLYKIYELFKAN